VDEIKETLHLFSRQQMMKKGYLSYLIIKERTKRHTVENCYLIIEERGISPSNNGVGARGALTIK
jgi:hypothetical protein